MEIQIPLVIFTSFLAWAAGIFGTQCILALQKRGGAVQLPALICSAAVLVVGGIAVVFHLTHPFNLFNGFGHITSGITQELIAIVVLAVVMVVCFVYLRRGGDDAYAGDVEDVPDAEGGHARGEEGVLVLVDHEEVAGPAAEHRGQHGGRRTICQRAVERGDERHEQQLGGVTQSALSKAAGRQVRDRYRREGGRERNYHIDLPSVVQATSYPMRAAV